MQIVLSLLLGGIVGWWLRHRRWRQELGHYRRRRIASQVSHEANRSSVEDRGAAKDDKPEQKRDDRSAEVERLRARIAELEAQLRDASGNAREARVEHAQTRILPSSRSDASAESEDGNVASSENRGASTRSVTRAASNARADDLKRVTGIGPKMERMLNGQGITTLAELAALDADDVKRLESSLDNFAGRIERDDWIGQARALLEADRNA